MLTPGTRVGPYEVTAQIGAGGMGTVYRARDIKLNRDVAIKVLAELAGDRDRLARFHREAQVLASLNHPNIAHVYGVEDTSATFALVMELVEGPTLADRIAQGPMPLDEALAIARQIADALEAAHDQGIVHRDLKPANIKVRDDGAVKVLDFGLAKLVDARASSDGNVTISPTLSLHATMAGVILGTAAYMSPEQARGKAVDKRADIWAFGCVLFEMVTGRRAFAGDDLTETIAAIVRDQPDLSGVPVQLRRLLARCFEKDPRRRLRDISDAWALVDDPATVRHQPASAAAPRWRRALPWACAAAAAVAATGLAVVHLSETRFVPSSVRFQLQVPNEAGSATPMLSPDGTRVAYRDNGQIWVRDLGSLEPRAIATTDRPVGSVFWSADSRFVIYAASGKLMRAPVAPGSPEALRDQSLVLGGGFGLPDGGFVVSSPSADASGPGETVRVDRSGERSLAGVALDLRGSQSLLPDGKRFLYTVTEPDAQRGVYLASIDGAKPPERILPDPSDVAYVPSITRRAEGYLLVVRQGTLLALPVDAVQLKSRGEPIELAKGVGSFTASSGDSFVYRLTGGRRLTWYDRRGTSTGIAWSPGPYMEVALSPGADRVAVVRADPPTTWLHEFARESSRKLPATLPVSIKPLWLPAGDRVLVLSTRSGQQAEFYSVSVSGGTEQLVLRTPMVAYPTSFSHDGKLLMYTAVNPRTKEDLWVAPLTANVAGTPEPFLVTENKETDGTFSPDGRAVAYVSDEGGMSNVWVRSFPSSGGHKWHVSTAGGYQPRWRNDGKELFYISPSGQLMSVEITPGIATAPGRPSLLFQTSVFGGGASVNNRYWDVTPDGERFLINTVIGGAEPSTLNVVLNWQAGISR